MSSCASTNSLGEGSKELTQKSNQNLTRSRCGGAPGRRKGEENTPVTGRYLGGIKRRNLTVLRICVKVREPEGKL